MLRLQQAKQGLLLTMFLIIAILLGLILSESMKPGENEYIVLPQVSKFNIPEVQASGEFIQVRVSHYWPELGGVNCYTFVNGTCVSKMANGKRWQEYVGVAIACPPEYEFGTKMIILDREWECMDRGSMIIVENGIPWVDMLIPYALVDYGTTVQAEII